MSALLVLQHRTAQDAAYRENRGRLATVFQSYLTTGQGSVEIEDRVDFGLLFIEQPFMAHGAHTDADDLRNLLGLSDTDDVDYPLVSGHVTSWDTDDQGNYIGAWVALTVQFATTIDASAQIQVEHHLQFTGVALKDIPQMDPSKS